MSSTGQKVGAVAATAILGGAGALFGGPIGLALGLVVGVGIDALILHASTPATPMIVPGVMANTMIPGAPALPPGADINSATQAVTLLNIANTARDPQAEAGPAKVWLTRFQTSVGLPATGALDPQSRAMLMIAVPAAAANLPAKTVLG